MPGRLSFDSETSPEDPTGPLDQNPDQPLLGSAPTQQSTGHVVSFQYGSVAIISCTALVLFLNCAVNGLVTLNILQIASDYDLSPGVELW